MNSKHRFEPFFAIWVICGVFASMALVVRATTWTMISSPHPLDIVLSITKTVTPDTDVALGSTVTYGIELENTSDDAALGVVLTDRLPIEVHFEEWLQSSGAIQANNMITWTGKVRSDEKIKLQFTVSVAAKEELLGRTVTNTAVFTSVNAGSKSSNAVFALVKPPPPPVTHTMHLPFVTKNHFDDPFEPNDTVAQAWGPLESGAEYYGYIPRKADANDYYYLIASSKDQVQVGLTVPEALDLDLWVYDTELTLVGGSAQVGLGVDEEVLFVPVADGTYYIRVYPYEGSSTTEPYILVAIIN